MVALGLALGLAPLAEAQPQSEKARAAWRLEEGKRALAKGDLDKAITALEEAHTVLRQPTSGVPLAQALVKKGRLADALAVARAVQASPKATKEAFSVTRARADADALVADLDKRVPKLRTTAPEGTAITVDGRDVPVDDGVRRVDPGDHTVEGKLGEKKASATVTLAEGDDKTVALDFGPNPGAAAGAGPTGASEEPGAAKGGSAPAPKASEDAEGPGDPAAATAAIVGFTTFAAGAGLGVGAFSWGTSRLDDLEGPCGGSCSGRLAREERDAEAMRLFGFVGFGLAGAGLVTGIVGAAVAGSASSSESAVTPEIGPTYAGLRVRLE